MQSLMAKVLADGLVPMVAFAEFLLDEEAIAAHQHNVERPLLVYKPDWRKRNASTTR